MTTTSRSFTSLGLETCSKKSFWHKYDCDSGWEHTISDPEGGGQESHPN